MSRVPPQPLPPPRPPHHPGAAAPPAQPPPPPLPPGPGASLGLINEDPVSLFRAVSAHYRPRPLGPSGGLGTGRQREDQKPRVSRSSGAE